MPVFLAEDIEIVRIAEAAWGHAVACAGREGAALEVVPIDLVDPGGGFSGKATLEAGRLVRIRLGVTRPRVIAHEVAHAWVQRGPPALVEGATALLEACVAGRAPDLFPSEPMADLGPLEDLRTWANEDDAAPSRDAGYAASLLLFQALATTVAPADLWRPEWSWAALDGLLAGAGPTGEAVRGVLAGGVAAQRAGLGDRDRDGVSSLLEGLAGTDPARWDTDGDGWWDGAPDDVERDGVPIAPGRGTVCSGRAAGPLGAYVRVRGGAAAGSLQLALELDALHDTPARGWVWLPPRASPVFRVHGTGGGWARLDGVGLVRDRRCWSDARWTVLVARGVDVPLEAFVAALRVADAAADGVLAPPAGPLQVLLGFDEGQVRSDYTPTPTSWLAGEDWTRAAARVVAEARLVQLGGEPRSAMGDALARALAGEPGLRYEAPEDDVAWWTERAAACGWAALLRGGCR